MALPGLNLFVQLSRDPGDEFVYQGALLCDTYLESSSTDEEAGQQTYTLQENCVPDGDERRFGYVRIGRTPLMRHEWTLEH